MGTNKQPGSYEEEIAAAEEADFDAAIDDARGGPITPDVWNEEQEACLKRVYAHVPDEPSDALLSPGDDGREALGTDGEVPHPVHLVGPYASDRSVALAKAAMVELSRKPITVNSALASHDFGADIGPFPLDGRDYEPSRFVPADLDALVQATLEHPLSRIGDHVEGLEETPVIGFVRHHALNGDRIDTAAAYTQLAFFSRTDAHSKQEAWSEQAAAQAAETRKKSHDALLLYADEQAVEAARTTAVIGRLKLSYDKIEANKSIVRLSPAQPGLDAAAELLAIICGPNDPNPSRQLSIDPWRSPEDVALDVWYDQVDYQVVLANDMNNDDTRLGTFVAARLGRDAAQFLQILDHVEDMRPDFRVTSAKLALEHAEAVEDDLLTLTLPQTIDTLATLAVLASASGMHDVTDALLRAFDLAVDGKYILAPHAGWNEENDELNTHLIIVG